MTCADVARLLLLEDAHASVDRTALAAHLAVCASCEDEHADVSWLLASRAAAPIGPRPAVTWPVRVPTVAVLVLLVSGILVSFGGEGSPVSGAPTDLRAAEAPFRLAPSELHGAPSSTVTIRGHRQPTSTFSSSVWTPPRPRCLDQEKP